MNDSQKLETILTLINTTIKGGTEIDAGVGKSILKTYDALALPLLTDGLKLELLSKLFISETFDDEYIGCLEACRLLHKIQAAINDKEFGGVLVL